MSGASIANAVQAEGLAWCYTSISYASSNRYIYTTPQAKLSKVFLTDSDDLKSRVRCIRTGWTQL